MEKVIGIGGIFFKAKDPKSLCEWYEKHLGIKFNGSTYVTFNEQNAKHPAFPGQTIFSFFNNDTKYFNPSEKLFMINFRVKNLELLLEDLQKSGISQVGETKKEVYGSFAWIMDPEANKIELWEPVEE